MNMYDVMYEAICDKYEHGEITLEDAELLNDVAYEKYMEPKKIRVKTKSRTDEKPEKKPIEPLHMTKQMYEDDIARRKSATGITNIPRKKAISEYKAYKKDFFIDKKKGYAGNNFMKLSIK